MLVRSGDAYVHDADKHEWRRMLQPTVLCALAVGKYWS
jgi:hypothetical protein